VSFITIQVVLTLPAIVSANDKFGF